MTVDAADSGASLRRTMYGLLIVLSLAHMLGRILAVTSVDRIGMEASLRQQGRSDWRQQRPFLSANDRSRWCTVRSLVELGTYQIDKIVVQPGWDTIDMVKHDGHLYSSKPPLLATLMAGEYWIIHRLTGATLASHPFAIGRFMLVTVNLVPLAIYFVVLARLVERYGQTDWGRLFVMAAATWGTFLSTFAVTINNHLIAAVSAALAMAVALRILNEPQTRPIWYLGAGLAAAFTAANELPATSFLVFLAVALLWRASMSARAAFAAGALVVAAGFFGTNYAAHGILSPPYAHRSEGANWYDYSYEVKGRVRDSYWRHPTGIDRGEPSRTRYAWHVIAGHHGIVSLTPVWILAVAGWFLCKRSHPPLWKLTCLVALTSVVCMAFYLSRPLLDRNYGGMTSGFRWMFWMAPLWLVTMLPATDWLARRRGLWRFAAYLLLALSVMSASYPTWNPWTHPWLYDWLVKSGWMKV